MFTRKERLETPESFDFPFTPYGIQREFMENLYAVIESRQIGIFESPTGTGKSLTLTCGSLKWLLDNYEAVKAELKKSQLDLQEQISERCSAEGSDWIDCQFEAIGMKEELQKLKLVHDHIQKYDRKMMEIKRNVHKMKRSKNTIPVLKRIAKVSLPEVGSATQEERTAGDSDLELDERESSEDEPDEEETPEEQPYRPAKIFFCSRTHSQLSQVVNEIKGTVYKDKIRVASLASRQIYCINDEVRQSGSQSLINEQCLDLQKRTSVASQVDTDGNPLKKMKKATKSTACPFYNKSNVEQLKNEILADVLDVEDLITAARRERACPYYAARAAAEDAQIVFLPYQLLLHKSTRLQSGIDIRDSIIIVDEAHNLMDTISAIHSSDLSLDQLRTALQQVRAYRMKFQGRFKASNLLKIKQIEFIIKQLVRLLSTDDDAQKEQQPQQVSHRMVLGYELMAEAEFFNLDVVKLLRFCDESRFAQKVQGLAQREAIAPPPPHSVNGTIRAESKSLLKQLEDNFNANKKRTVLVAQPAPSGGGDNAKTVGAVKGGREQKQVVPQVIRPLLAFLQSLTEKSSDGRVLIQSGVKLKYLLLNCGAHFQDILRDCRSVSEETREREAGILT